MLQENLPPQTTPEVVFGKVAWDSVYRSRIGHWDSELIPKQYQECAREGGRSSRQSSENQQHGWPGTAHSHLVKVQVTFPLNLKSTQPDVRLTLLLRKDKLNFKCIT